MSTIQEELNGLQTLKNDFARHKEVEAKIEEKKKQITSIENLCTKVSIPEPVLNEDKVHELEMQRKKFCTQAPETLMLLPLLAFIGIGLYITNFGHILAFILVFLCAHLTSFFSTTPQTIGLGLSVFLSRNIWGSASKEWQMVFLGLGVVYIVLMIWDGVLFSKKKEFDKKIEQEKKSAAFRLEREKEEHRKAVAQKIKEKRQNSQGQIDEIKKEIEELQVLNKKILAHIAENNVLDNADKSEEIVDYLMTQIQRKRANSLSEALRMYDAEQEKKTQKEKAEKQRLIDMRLKYELEQNERDRKAWADLEESNRRFDFEMSMKREQKHQTEELERIRKALEE